MSLYNAPIMNTYNLKYKGKSNAEILQMGDCREKTSIFCKVNSMPRPVNRNTSSSNSKASTGLTWMQRMALITQGAAAVGSIAMAFKCYKEAKAVGASNNKSGAGKGSDAGGGATTTSNGGGTSVSPKASAKNLNSTIETAKTSGNWSPVQQQKLNSEKDLVDTNTELGELVPRISELTTQQTANKKIIDSYSANKSKAEDIAKTDLKALDDGLGKEIETLENSIKELEASIKTATDTSRPSKTTLEGRLITLKNEKETKLEDYKTKKAAIEKTKTDALADLLDEQHRAETELVEINKNLEAAKARQRTLNSEKTTLEAAIKRAETELSQGKRRNGVTAGAMSGSNEVPKFDAKSTIAI